MFKNSHLYYERNFFSTALILALKTLQEKIHRLELERTQAEDNLNILSKEAAEYKKALENETNERNLVHQELIKQKKGKKVQNSSQKQKVAKVYNLKISPEQADLLKYICSYIYI